MHKLPIFSLILIPLVAAACADDADDSMSVTISTTRAPEAIAYRDGIDGEWHALTATGTGSYKVDVSGPYMVSVVCSAASGSTISTRQIARTPDDGAEIDLACAEPKPLAAEIKATMVQPGTVAVGAASASSDQPNWAIDLDVPAGTADLLGVTADRILIKRDLAVSGTLDLGTLDAAQTGVALVPAALSASNAATGETVEAEIRVSTPRTALAWSGAPADSKIAPPTFLTGDLRQSVAMTASKGDATRMVRREFRAGEPTALALPEALGAVQLEAAGGKLAATWSALPEHDKVVLSVTGSQAAGNIREHAIELSRSFLAATGATSATVDTDLPGYQAAWKLDLTREHQRELQVVRERDGVHAESAITKLVPAQP
jgi:hypothetical protein